MCVAKAVLPYSVNVKENFLSDGSPRDNLPVTEPLLIRLIFHQSDENNIGQDRCPCPSDCYIINVVKG